MHEVANVDAEVGFVFVDAKLVADFAADILVALQLNVFSHLFAPETDCI